jgi:hypothetical protein
LFFAASTFIVSCLRKIQQCVSVCNRRQRHADEPRFMLSDTANMLTLKEITSNTRQTTTEDCTMKKVLATLIAGLFATAAFAQTPAAPAAPAAAPAAASAPAASASAKTEAAAPKAKKHHKAKKAKAAEKAASASAEAAPAK